MRDAGQRSLLLSEGMKDRGLRESKQMSNLSMHEVGFRCYRGVAEIRKLQGGLKELLKGACCRLWWVAVK